MHDRPWHVRDPAAAQLIRDDLARHYPSLHLLIADGAATVRGTFPVLGDLAQVLDRFLVDIRLPPAFPRVLPETREIGGRIPWTRHRHVGPGGVACVLLTEDRWRCYPPGAPFITYLKVPLRNFFLGQLLVEHGEPWPFGEWGHDAEGILEFYHEELRTQDPAVIRRFLNALRRRRLQATLPCPCGSGRRVAACCIDRIRCLRDRIPPDVADESLSTLRLAPAWAALNGVMTRAVLDAAGAAVGVNSQVQQRLRGQQARLLTAVDQKVPTGVESHMPAQLLIVRHKGPWPFPALSGVLHALADDRRGLPTEYIEVDTSLFDTDVEKGEWSGQDLLLTQKADEVRARLRALEDAEVHYFGLAEVPHVIALGAALGDEVPLELHEYHRDSRSWQWPTSTGALRARVLGLPAARPVARPGAVVLRVEISFAISNADIREVIGTDHLAQVRVTVAKGRKPVICAVRSAADLLEVRVRIREALSAIRTSFPNCSIIHLFVAAPVPVCFALGQELKPRNSPPIQTYRYRKVPGAPAYTPAIRLGGVETLARRPVCLQSEQVATEPQLPRHIGTAKLARRLELKEPNHMAHQLRAALIESGQAAPPAKRGKPVVWTREQLERALPHLPQGQLRTGLEQSGLSPRG